MIHTFLYNNAKLVSFKEGEVIINTSSIVDQHYLRTIAKLASTWTERIWQISSSTSNIGKTLYEEDIILQQKDIEVMKTDPEIRNILETFSGVYIQSITNINESIQDKKSFLEIKKTEEK